MGKSSINAVEDGAFTVSTSDAEQIMNPEGWKLPHDWVDSRNWAATVGYGEFGTWNCPRRPLTCIHSGFGRSPQDYEKYLRPLYERYGFEKRILNVQIVKRAEEN